MIAGYLSSRMDRGTWLRGGLEGSLPGLRVSGPVLSGRESVEGRRYWLEAVATMSQYREETYRDPLDHDAVLRAAIASKS